MAVLIAAESLQKMRHLLLGVWINKKVAKMKTSLHVCNFIIKLFPEASGKSSVITQAVWICRPMRGSAILRTVRPA